MRAHYLDTVDRIEELVVLNLRKNNAPIRTAYYVEDAFESLRANVR